MPYYDKTQNNQMRGLSDKREVGTGVAIVKKRNTLTGLKIELMEIQRHLDNTGDHPLNKTEYERLRKRKNAILRMLSGADPRWSTMRGRAGPPRENERVPFGVKKSSMDIMKALK